MTASIKVIATIMGVLLSAAWFSPCCCQSAWLADQGALLLAPAEGSKGCCCCEGGKGKHRECCPLGAKECKSSFGKMLTARVVTELAPTHEWIVWAWQPVGISAAEAAPRRLARAQGPFFGPHVTLFGLRCALTI